MSTRPIALGIRLMATLAVTTNFVVADETFDKLFSAGNYAEAIKYADEKISIGDRDAAVWAKLGTAYEGQEMIEKALACYMVAIRNDANSYEAHLGAARINNKLNQYENGLEMAKKALALKVTGEASWEYARACLALKSPETKTALEKVVETDKNNAVANRELGNLYYGEKNFEKALPLLKNSYNAQSDGETAYKLAVTYNKQQNLDSAAHYYKEATRDAKFKNPEAGLELSRIYYKQEKYAPAAEEFGKLDQSLLSADDLYKFGHSLSKAGQSKDAVAKVLEAAVAKFGNTVSKEALLAREKVGKAKLEKKAFQEALNLFLEISKADPQGKIVHDQTFLIAEAYDGLGERKNAIPMLEKVISTDKNNIEAYARLADLYSKEKMGEQAQQVYQKLLSLQPNNPQVYRSLGEYSLKTKKYEDALKYYQKSFTLEQTSEAAIGMMQSAWELKSYDLARDAAESALHKDPNLQLPQLIMAKININDKNYTAAQNLLEKLVKTDNNNIEVWRLLATCYEQTKNNAKLAEADKTIMNLDKKDVASRQRYAVYAQTTNDYKSALETYKQLAELTPKDAAVYKNLNSLSLKLENKDDAVNYMRKYLRLMPKDAAAHKDLGNLLFEKKDSTGALNAYQAALQNDPSIKGFYKNYVVLIMAQEPPKKVVKGQKTQDEQIFEALSAAVGAGEADEKIYTSLGEIQFKKNSFSAAADMYQKALQQNPKNLNNLSALALCQEKSGKIDDAIITLEQVASLNQSAVAEYKSLGNLYLKNGKKEQAIANYKKYLAKESDSKIANLIAESEFEKKNYKEAVKYYEMVSGNLSKDPKYLLNYGVAAFQENDLKKASELFKALTTVNPKDPEPFKTLYEIALKEKNQALAAEYLQKYTNLKPADTPMLLALGNLYYDLKNNDGALAAYKAVFKADPTVKDFYKRYLELLNKNGTADEKIQALNGAVNAGQADVAAYIQLGDLYKQASNFSKAIPCYEKASQLDPKNTAILNSLAECQVKTGTVSAAILTYEQAIAMNPQASAEFKVLGDLYKKDKKTEAAVKNYKKYLEKSSDNALAKEIGEFAYSQKNYAEAIKYMDMVTGADAEKTDFLKMYADAYFQNKDEQKAYQIYKKVGDKTTNDADVFKKLYEIALKLGSNDDVLVYLKKYTSLKPADVNAQRTLGDKLYDKKDSTAALAAYRAVLKADSSAKGFYQKYTGLLIGSGATDEEVATAIEAGIAAGEANVTMYNHLAAIYTKQGKNAKAVAMYEKASQLDPKSISLLSSLGEAQAKSGNTKGAITTYEQAIAMNPEANEEYKTLGQLYKKDNNIEQAVKNFKKYLEKNSDNKLASEIGEFAYNKKNYTEAIKYLGMVNGADAEKVKHLKMLADANYQSKDDAKAYEIFKKLSGKAADDADVFHKLYEIASKTGKNNEALEYLKKYTSLKPADVEAQRTLGDKLFDTKDSAGALTAYRAVLKADPKAKGFYKKYAELVMNSAAKDEEIVPVLNAGITAGEADVKMYERLASIYSKQGNHTGAVQMYEKASQLDTKNINLITSLGESQAKSGNVSGAIMTYEQAVAMNPMASAEYKTLGDLYKKDKKTDAAIKNYKKYLEKNSDDKLAKEIGEYAYAQKNYPEVIKYFSMVKGAEAENTAFLKMYADAYYQNKDDAKAYEIYKKVSVKAANDAEIFRNLYEIAAKTGNNDEYLQYLKKYTLLKPTDVQAQRTLGDKLYDKKENDGALAAYRAVLKADPNAKGFYKKYAELIMGSAAKDDEIAAVLNAGISAGEADVNMYERLATIYSKQGDHAKSVQMYEKASQLDPKNIKLISLLAESQAKSGNVSNAIMTYEQSIAMNPQANNEFKILGDLYKKDKKIDAAIKNYKKFLEKNSDNLLAKEIGEFAYGQKNYPEAIKYLGMVTGADAENIAFLKMYADAYYQNKEEAKAYEIFRKLFTKAPNDADVVKMLYEIAEKSGSKGDALTYLQKYTALRPADVEAQRTLGDKLYEKKDNAGALAAYKAVLKVNPNAKGFYKKYAELIINSAAKDEEIIAVLTAGIEAGEADITMYQRLAEIYNKQGSHSKAVAMYEKASQLDTKNIALITSLGEAQAKSGNVSGAIMTYEQAVAMNPQANKEYKILGDLYKKDKKTESSIKNYKKYLEKNSDNGLAAEIGEFAYSQKNFADAIKYLSMVTGADAEKPALLKMYADANYQNKDNLKAYEIYKKLADKTPADAEVFQNLYEIAEKTGKNDEFLLYLKKYTALKPADVKAQRTLGDKLYEKKDEAGALAAYRAVLKADPKAKGFYKKYAELVINSKAKDEEISAVLNAGIAAGEADGGMYETLAAIYARQANHAKAVEMYEKASQLDPKNLALLSSLAESQAKSGNVSGAILTYEQAIAMNPQASKEYKVLGDLYKKSNKTESAIKNYKKYLEKNADNNLAQEIGGYALEKKDYPEAIKYLGMVNGAAAAEPKFLKLFGEACFQAKDEFRAFQIYKQLGEKTPTDADVFERLYTIAGKTGTKDDVLNYLKKYTTLKPTDVEALKKLGDMLYESKDSQGALNAYRAVLKADPNAKGFHRKYAGLVMKSEAKDIEVIAVLNGGIAAGEADVAMYERLANIYSKQGNHAKAVQMYEKASQLDTKNVKLLGSLAESQAKSGNVNGAILTYEQAIAMNPQASSEYKVLGDLYKADKKIESAIKNYQKYLEKNKDSDLAVEIGKYSFGKKNYSDAVKYFGLVTGKDAEDPALLKQYGQACYEMKDYQKAYQIYQKVAEKTPADADVMLMLYEIAGKNNSKEDALTYLKKYTALKPAVAEKQKELGDLLYERNDAVGAIAAYGAVVKADPAAKGFYKKYAELVMKSGKDQEIIPVLQGAIAAGEADVKMYVKLGSIYFAQNDFVKAVQMYESASRLDPKNGTLLINLADAQAKSGKISEAVLTYEQAVAMNPTANQEYKALGDLYMKQKKTDSAIKAYKKYLEKSQDNSIAKLIGDNAVNGKNYTEAVKYLAMVTGAEATEKEHLMKFAMACYHAKDEFRAYQLFKQLANVTPQDPVVYEKLYEIAKKAGTQEEVLNYLKKYASLKPSDAKAQITLGDILYEKKDEAGALSAYRAALKADSTVKGFYKRYAALVIESGSDAEKVIALNGAIAQGEADARIYSTLADLYNKQNQLDKAIAMYEKAAQLDNKNSQLLFAMANCQLKKGSVNEAILTLEQAVAINPRADKELKQLGDLYLTQKKADAAISYYKKYLDKNPGDDQVALIVGEEAFKTKNYQDAVKFLAMVKGAESKKASFLTMYGEASYETKDYPRALGIYKQLSILTPKDAEIFKKLYEINSKSGAHDEALVNLKKFTALKPTDAEAQKYLGDALYERKEMVGAYAAYQNALKYDPKIKGFHKRYVELVSKYGKAQDKMPALLAAIAANEANADIYSQLGEIYVSQKNFIKAIEMFEKASQLEPKNAQILTSLADCQVKKGDLKSAALTYEQAVAMNPGAVKEYKDLGDLYMKQKKTDAAMNSYKKYLGKAPDDYSVAKLVAENYYSAKDYANAYKYFAMVKNDDTPQFLIAYGLSAVSVKESKVAIEILEKLRTIKGPFASKDVAYKTLAEAYEAAGNQKKASEVLNEYVKIPGVKDPDASYKRAAVYESINATEAVEMYKQNILSFPKDHRNYLKLGIYYSRQKAGEANAIKYLEKVTVLADTIPRVYLELGSLYLRLKRDQDMLKAYRKYLEVAPEDAEAIGKIGEVLLSRKMVDDAMVFLEIANAQKENDPKIMTLLARGYIMTKRRKEGADLLEKVVKLTKGMVDDDLRMVLVDVYIETNQFLKASEELKILMGIKKDKDVMIKYSRVLFELGKHNDALSIVQEVKSKDPENLDAMMMIGKIRTAQKKYDDAIETYKEILYIDQNYAPALCERANVYLIQGKNQWAQTFYDRALKADPKNAMVHLGLARLAKQQKDYLGYSDHLEKARKLDPQNKEILEEVKSVRR